MPIRARSIVSVRGRLVYSVNSGVKPGEGNDMVVGLSCVALGYMLLQPVMGRVARFQHATNLGWLKEPAGKKPDEDFRAFPLVTAEPDFFATTVVAKEGAGTLEVDTDEEVVS